MNTHHSIMKLLLNPTQVSIKPLYDLCLLFCVIAYIDHQCKYPGCSNVLVIDGNLKNRRAVCAASEAGYLQCPGLCGTIKSGCQLTPLQTSKYCYQHANRVSNARPQCQDNQMEEDIPQSIESTQSESDGIIKFILSRKQTRNGAYYQVHTLCYSYSACA